jgi:hypothetical protein
MNPESNRFEPVNELIDGLEKQIRKIQGQLFRPDGTPVPKHWSVFTVGENYVINKYTFKCAYIGETSILFEPVGPLDINVGESGLVR